ncbi:DUF1294 domain-containing protein [Pseudoflavonifractor sp. AF19-9AC]|uniref:DUF1294 domain-containing protein n=1 Tax=Pseudoflavonifractor sp. AF19-9AC TaxID=2292244 RepID=UPI0018F71FAF|nr:DUF1294 domain-containing protein [Pseudoflavonifractor sp. AF19-9AC]
MPAFLIKAALVWLAALNLIAFILMGLDKWKARRGAWRIPEKTLFLAALLGGALGGTVGMHLFHHKTRHWYFRFGFPILLVLQLLLAGFLAFRLQ